MIGDLADNRKNVGRWVSETRKAAGASAERRQDIARRPAAPAHVPAPSSSRRWPSSARPRTRRRPRSPTSTPRPASSTACSTDLPDFADASRKNLNSLADAGQAGPARGQGRPADRSPSSTRAPRSSPELASNAAIVLTDLDDRKRATEKDPRSPGGQGYTGFEAVLQYVFDQAMAINIYDANGYMLKVNAVRLEVQRLPEPGVAEEEAQGGPELLQGLRRRSSARTSRASRRPTRRSRARVSAATRIAPTPPRASASATTATTSRRCRRPATPNPPSAGGNDPTQKLPAPRPAAAAAQHAAGCPRCRACRSCRSRRSRTLRSSRCRRRPRSADQQPRPPRLPPRAMRRRALSQPGPRRRGHRRSSSSSPCSWPTTPTTACRSCRPTTLKVHVPNGANLVEGNEVRSGGYRVGVDRPTCAPVRLRDGTTGAELDAQARQERRRRPARLDRSASARARRSA